MKKHKVKLFAVVLVILTVVAAILHLNTREVVAEGNLQLKAGETTMNLDISEFDYQQVTGVRMNGKGEKIPVDAPVIAGDSYSAEISAEEVEDGTKAFLIVDDEKKLRLVVFGDTNSKRSVSDVVQIVVE